jgi:hypothetical protein
VETPEASIPVRVYVSRGAPATVYYHGGGFVIGDLDTHDASPPASIRSATKARRTPTRCAVRGCRPPAAATTRSSTASSAWRGSSTPRGTLDDASGTLDDASDVLRARHWG